MQLSERNTRSVATFHSNAKDRLTSKAHLHPLLALPQCLLSSPALDSTSACNSKFVRLPEFGGSLTERSSSRWIGFLEFPFGPLAFGDVFGHPDSVGRRPSASRSSETVSCPQIT